MSPVYPVRTTSPERCLVLTPAQARTILDGCSTVGAWSGSLAAVRDRVLLTTFAHAGMETVRCRSPRPRLLLPGAL